jgi:hypothetical protein
LAFLSILLHFLKKNYYESREILKIILSVSSITFSEYFWKYSGKVKETDRKIYGISYKRGKNIKNN